MYLIDRNQSQTDVKTSLSLSLSLFMLYRVLLHLNIDIMIHDVKLPIVCQPQSIELFLREVYNKACMFSMSRPLLLHHFMTCEYHDPFACSIVTTSTRGTSLLNDKHHILHQHIKVLISQLLATMEAPKSS